MKKAKAGVDKLVAMISALGVPGLVLLIAMNVAGFAGAAALTAALASLGGPFGMLGGIAVLGLLVMISRGLTDYGFETIYKGVVTNLYKQGTTKQEILQKIQGYPISRSLKRTLKEVTDEQPE